MRKVGLFLLVFCFVPAGFAQELSGLLAGLTQPHDYVLKRVSSWDRTGGNADMRHIAAAKPSRRWKSPAPASLPTSGSPSRALRMHI
jgi:hypothetical protein